MERDNTEKPSPQKLTLESGHYFRPLPQHGVDRDDGGAPHGRRGSFQRREHDHTRPPRDRDNRYRGQHQRNRPFHQSRVSLEAFPGTTSLVQLLDRKILVVLRDGKKYVGTLRSYDQYGTIILQDTVERVYIQDQYGEQDCGVYLVRGENIMLLCELDEERDSNLPLEKRPMIEMLTKQKEAAEESRRIYRLRRQIHRDFGNLMDSDMIMMVDADI